MKLQICAEIEGRFVLGSVSFSVSGVSLQTS